MSSPSNRVCNAEVCRSIIIFLRNVVNALGTLLLPLRNNAICHIPNVWLMPEGFIPALHCLELAEHTSSCFASRKNPRTENKIGKWRLPKLTWSTKQAPDRAGRASSFLSPLSESERSVRVHSEIVLWRELPNRKDILCANASSMSNPEPPAFRVVLEHF